MLGEGRHRGWEGGGVEEGGRAWPWGKGCSPGGKIEPKCFHQQGHNFALNMVQLLYRIKQSFCLPAS